MNDDLPDDLVDSKEAARILRLALPVIHRWRASGRVRGWRRGGRWFYSRAELLRLFVPSSDRPTMPPTRQEMERRAAAAGEELRRRGW